MQVSTREAAVKLLAKTLNGGYSNYLFESFLAKNPEIPDNDTRFLKALYFGVLRKLLLLDRLIAERCSSPYEKLPEQIKQALRIGFYQILFMESVPSRAAVYESVQLAKKYGHAGTAKLVNALLRRAATERQEMLAWIETPEKKTIEDEAAITSHPLWLVKRYYQRFGRDAALEILERNNEIPPSNFRIRKPAEFEKAVGRYDLEHKKNRFNRLGVEIKKGDPKTVIELMRDGVIAPQDQSSLVAVSLMEGARGSLLELCCGRGNKSEAMLDYVGKKTLIVNADISAGKLADVKGLGRQRLNPVCFDLTGEIPFKNRFGHIFLDAPCSNLGTVRRHPEIRYRRSIGQLAEFADFQLKALLAASELLAANGKLIYAVCSFEPEETTRVVDRFLELRPRFSPLTIAKMRPDLAGASLTDQNYLTLLPGAHGMDGFFAAVLQPRP